MSLLTQLSDKQKRKLTSKKENTIQTIKLFYHLTYNPYYFIQITKGMKNRRKTIKQNTQEI